MRPLVEVDIGGGKAAALVMREPEPTQLTSEVDDIGISSRTRMGAGLHCVLLGGQTEGVEAECVQHIAACHPEIPGVNIGGDVAQRMTDVQALARRVGKHVLHKHLVPRDC